MWEVEKNEKVLVTGESHDWMELPESKPLSLNDIKR